MSWMWTTFATVLATWVDRNAPTRLSTPDRATATFGFSAPVAIDVAIAFPVSWKPLVKSNASAVPTTSTRMMNSVMTRSVAAAERPVHRRRTYFA